MRNANLPAELFNKSTVLICGTDYSNVFDGSSTTALCALRCLDRGSRGTKIQDIFLGQSIGLRFDILCKCSDAKQV